MLVAYTKRGLQRMPEGLNAFRLGRLGDNLAPLGDVTPAQYNSQVGGDSLFTGGIIGAAGSVPTSSPFSDWFANAATGSLSPAQQAALQSQETASLTQAGMDPTQAAQQATQDVTGALQTFTAPGAFGISWTGADSSGVPSLLSAIPGWMWLALAGVGILLVVKVIK
jgi:hypothetical protein